MNKRDFLGAASLAAILPAAAAAAGTAARSPALLTLTGAIGRTNRGPLDPVLDEMMVKHGLQFTKACEFDSAALRRLPAATIHPTLEYDAKPHALSGPALETVLEAAGVRSDAAVQLGLRAVDGYNVAVSLADARRWRMLLALDIDGRPLGLGGLGPQWAVYDADRVAPFRDKPLQERFALCPWALYHVEVRPT
ncbi:MAG TPA: molybdopterin-dependent oxidoreductase [Ideonella sp.]|nr:molybdopterin-dependent oxidoreductase [Ideonella sp.]